MKKVLAVIPVLLLVIGCAQMQKVANFFGEDDPQILAEKVAVSNHDIFEACQRIAANAYLDYQAAIEEGREPAKPYLDDDNWVEWVALSVQVESAQNSYVELLKLAREIEKAEDLSEFLLDAQGSRAQVEGLAKIAVTFLIDQGIVKGVVW